MHISEPLQVRNQVDRGVKPTCLMWEQETAAKQITERGPILSIREAEANDTCALGTSLTLKFDSY